MQITDDITDMTNRLKESIVWTLNFGGHSQGHIKKPRSKRDLRGPLGYCLLTDADYRRLAAQHRLFISVHPYR